MRQEIINNRYKILATIGSGGMGTVYKVQDQVHSGTFALKMLLSHNITPELKSHFEREFRILSKLAHPNLARVYDYGSTSDGTSYFTMDYVEGLNINEYLKGKNYDEFYDVVIQVCHALEYIHSRGLIHGDIKPSNIIVETVGEKYTTKIVDFGLAQPIDLFNLRKISGTLEYIAPEMTKMEWIDGRADLYSLGVVLYEILTNKCPFESDSAFSLIRQHLERRVQPLSVFNPDIPSVIEDIILKLLEKEPSQRYQTAYEVSQEISKISGKKVQFETKAIYESYILSGKFVGREKDFALLKECFEKTERENSGYLVLISGDPGIGKSRLMREFKYYVQLNKVNFLTGHCYENGGEPYQPFVEVLRQLVPLAERITPEIIDTYSNDIAKLLPERQLSEIITFEHRPDVERFKLIDSISRFILEVANHVPLVINLGGFHWADESSIETLKHLVRNFTHSRILVCITFRHYELEENQVFEKAILELKKDEHTVSLKLEKLDKSAVTDLILSMFGLKEIPEEFLEKIVEETGGNPFFLEEIMKSIAEEKIIFKKNGKWEINTKRLKTIEIPTGISDVINKRLQKLEKNSFEILNLMAVVTRPITIDVLQECIKMKKDELYDILNLLEQKRIIVEEKTPEGYKYNYYHKKIRDVIYNSISNDEKNRLHEQMGYVLEKICAKDSTKEYENLEELAFHFMKGLNEEKAINYCIKAGDKSKKIYANEKAIEFYEEALRHLALSSAIGTDKKKINVFKNLGDVYQLVGEYNKALDDYEKMLEFSEAEKDENNRADALKKIGDLFMYKSDYQEANRFFTESLNIFRKVGDKEGESNALNGIGNINWHLGFYDDAIKCYSESLEIKKQMQDMSGMSIVLNNIGNILSDKGEYDKAMDCYKDALKMKENLNDKNGISILQMNIGTLHTKRGLFDESLKYYNNALQIKKKVGDKRGVSLAIKNIGFVYQNIGLYDTALRYLDEALEIDKEMGNLQWMAVTLDNIGRTYARLGLYEKALKFFTDAIDILKEIGIKKDLGYSIDASGDVYQIIGDYTKAMILHEESLAIAVEIQEKEQEGKVLGSLGYDLYLKGKAQEGKERAEKGLKILKELGQKEYGMYVLEYCAQIECGINNREKSVELSTELLNTAKKSNSKEFTVKALMILAKNFISENKHSEALSNLEEALNTSIELKMPELEWEINYLIGKIYHQKFELYKAQGYYTKADFILQKIVENLSSELKEIYQSEKRRLEFRRDLKALNDQFAQKTPSEKPRSVVRERGLWTLYEISKTINSILDYNRLLEKIMDMMVEIMRAERGFILLFDDRTNSFEVKIARNVEKESIENVTEISESIVKDVVRTGIPVVSTSAIDDERFRTRKSIIDLRITSLMCVPFIIKDKIIGAVYVDTRSLSDHFTNEDLEFLVSFSNLAAISLENARLHEKLAYENVYLKEENIYLRKEVERKSVLSETIIGKSDLLQKVLRVVESAMRTSSNVLIEGESGTGKELIARALHYNSERKDKKFVPVDCGSLPETLLESELFGHKKGAFSGATIDKKGLFEEADGGTIFLDEITNTSKNLQSKLLRAIQEGEIRRVGDTQMRKIDVRIISATNVDLQKEVEKGNFREDLFYRLKVITIKIPSLRIRKDDIFPLANHFLDELNKKFGIVKRFSPEVMDLFMRYDWPGNVRELKNKIEQAYILTEDERITGVAFPDIDMEERRGTEREMSGDLKDRMAQIEKRILLQELSNQSWNIAKTAKILNLSRRALYDKIIKYNLERKGEEKIQLPTED